MKVHFSTRRGQNFLLSQPFAILVLKYIEGILLTRFDIDNSPIRLTDAIAELSFDNFIELREKEQQQLTSKLPSKD